MEFVKSHSDHARVIFATFLWAGISTLMATAVGLPLMVLGPVAIAASPWKWDSIGPMASGLFGSALGGLVLYGALRCTVLSVATVCRSPGYPARHWWFVRRAFLKQIAHALERADFHGIPFSFLLRHSTVSNGQEWDMRQGTCA